MAKAMRSSTQRISRLVRPPSRKEQTVSRRFLFILLSCLALAASSLARADDAVSSGGGGAPAGDKPTLTKNTVPSAIRVAVANGGRRRKHSAHGCPSGPGSLRPQGSDPRAEKSAPGTEVCGPVTSLSSDAGERANCTGRDARIVP